MSYAAANNAQSKPGYEEAVEAAIHKIRITLTSRNVKNLEKGNSKNLLLFNFLSPFDCFKFCDIVDFTPNINI
jgi:hypothetical protein